MEVSGPVFICNFSGSDPHNAVLCKIDHMRKCKCVKSVGTLKVAVWSIAILEAALSCGPSQSASEQRR